MKPEWLEVSNITVNENGEELNLFDILSGDENTDPLYLMLTEEAESFGFPDVESYLLH